MLWIGASLLGLLGIISLAWHRYCHVLALSSTEETPDPFRLRDEGAGDLWCRAPHQRGAQWLHEIFERSAARYPEFTALQVAATGEVLSYRALNQRAEQIAAAIAPYITAPDQVVAVSLEQNQADIVAVHLAILKAGAAQLFLDPAAPPAMREHMIRDANPVLLVHGDEGSDWTHLPKVNVSDIGLDSGTKRHCPAWLKDPGRRLAALFYTSGTTGQPKGVECAHAGYINLARSYASYFDFTPGADATSLTSSLGYDGSISELYSAWVFGAAVVLITKEEVRSGPDLIAILKREEVTALFCPPVLLSTLSDRPEHDLPYPICRYIIPAGEAFPANLVEPWSRARRQIINTYGPTEASTDTSRQLLSPGKPVTIGSPFPGVDYLIMEPGTLRALPEGETGELCIGGCHLALGYRNLPEATTARFVEHPEYGRLYRTGDRCRVNPDSRQVEFQGRLDAQLKVRGHRVEAQGIESFLQDSIDDIDSAVIDYQNDELVAFVIAPERAVSAWEDAALQRAPAAWTQSVQSKLRQYFPEHAIPSRLFLVPEFPLKPLSGKIDRERLPDIPTVRQPSTRRAMPETTATHALSGSGMEVLAICRSVLGDGLNWEDDFVEWGAHSIAMAKLTQALRRAGYQASVRGLLTDFRTPRLAGELPRLTETPQSPRLETPSNAPASARTSAHPPLDPHAFSMLQGLGILTLYLPTLVAMGLLILWAEPEDTFIAGDLAALLISALAAYLLYLLTPFLNLAWVRVLNALTGLKPVSPGEYCKWSREHWQVWWRDSQQRVVLQPMNSWLRAPGVYAWLLRALGAQVGHGTHVSQSTEILGPLSMIHLGHGVVVQSGVQICSQYWRGDRLIIDAVSIGSGSKLGQRSLVAAGTSLGENCWLTPLSAPKQGAAIANGLMIDGVACEPVGARMTLRRPDTQLPPSDRRTLVELRGLVLQFLLECLLIVLPATLIFSAISNGLLRQYESSAASSQSGLLADFFLSAVVATWLTLVVTSILTCLFVRATAFQTGLLRGASIAGVLLRYRQEKMNQIQRLWTWTLTGQYLRRLAGVRYGRTGASECDTMMNLVPEMLSTTPNIFMANSCRTNQMDDDGEWIVLRSLHLGDNSFLGNNSVVESGALPDNLLLGVSTPVGDHQFRRSTANPQARHLVLAGNPAIPFAQPEGIAGGTERPSWLLFNIRVLIGDLMGMALVPAMPILVLGILLLVGGNSGLADWVTIPLALVGSGVLLQLMAIAVKAALVPTGWGENHQTPFWSLRHFTYFLAQDCFFRWAGPTLRHLGGTALASPMLRAFGCRIGRGSIFQEPLQAFDWHAVDVGDNCVIQGLMQLHSFEHRLLTVRRTRIESHSAVNMGATVMGGATLAQHTTVGGLGLVMKGMELSPGNHEGSPVSLERDL